jgi:hypothetical protein
VENQDPVENLLKYFEEFPEEKQWELLDKLAEKLAERFPQPEYDADEEY